MSSNGSTITQQLSKVVLTGQQRTYTRKLKEAVLSIMIDAMYEKDQILMLSHESNLFWSWDVWC